MLDNIKEIFKQRVEDVELTGFVDTEDGVVEFYPEMQFLYFQLSKGYIEFESVCQFSKLKMELVESIRHNFEIDEDMSPGKSSVGKLILLDPMASGNFVKKIIFYNLHVIENNVLLSDALLMQLLNGQEIFIDPSFYFGINVGGRDQEKFWRDNMNIPITETELLIDL